MPEFIVAITGASGGQYARRLIGALSDAGVGVHLIVSKAGALVLAEELKIRINPLKPDVTALIGDRKHQVVAHSYKNFAASIASGTHRTDGMVVVPCTTGTLGSIASGTCRSLIDRAADVTLKERRKLILVVRETPLSLIHLQNMLQVTQAGGMILPACPGFYSGQQSLDEMIDFVVGKVLDALGIDNTVMKRWKE